MDEEYQTETMPNMVLNSTSSFHVENYYSNEYSSSVSSIYEREKLESNSDNENYDLSRENYSTIDSFPSNISKNSFKK